ncbi:MAG TPA: A/G-specific adenine glycosylase [Thermomicrobiales bacterium]|nr:A/G-specific adenine glycosylase [Thermomicrobiales bacterium]
MPVSRAETEHSLLDDASIAALHDLLLDWFAKAGRDLPWRHTRDPYRILVSEVMLQQIQVVRAVPFYETFVGRFPRVESLASAALADVIRVWGDLGRYRRIVYLHQTARIVVEQHGGVVPRDVATLRTLPGVGPYTAGAVACFAYEIDVAFIDTNMKRVLHRALMGPEHPDHPVKESELLALAERLLPPARAWQWNSALMDLGATVCTSRRPNCLTCPLLTSCRSAEDFLAGRASPTAVRKTPPYRFEESNRFYRGRVLATLRSLPTEDDTPNGIGLEELGRTIRDDFAEEHFGWLRSVVGGLAKDGLAAISEESPAYDAEATVRVSLP